MSPRPPTRLIHLGLGNFFQAHQAAYTAFAPDAEEWGYVAFGGRGSARAALLAEQGCRYTLVVRGSEVDELLPVESVVAAHAASDETAWLRSFADPAVAAVTMTVTEAGYLRSAAGGADLDHQALRDDVGRLRGRGRPAAASGGTTAAVTGPSGIGAPLTAPARLLAGLDARRRADAGPITMLPCDNLAANGDALRRVLLDVASVVDGELLAWIEESVAVVSTVVDRITPRPTEADLAAVARATGTVDRCAVVTEPFSEWVISAPDSLRGGLPSGESTSSRSAAFAGGRPDWGSVGATFVADVGPFERRKLWLLNGAHSLLAYAGPLGGHTTVAEAFADPMVRTWVEEWWDEASAHLDPAADPPAYRAALAERFTNPRMAHRLEQIAADGSEKLPIRTVPALRAERAAGRSGTGAARVVAAWLCHLRGGGTPVSDPRAEDLVTLAGGPWLEASKRVLSHLAPDLAEDAATVEAVAELAEELTDSQPPG